MKFLLIIIFYFTFISISFPQCNEVWFPEDLNIQPFTANFIEPKAGFSYLLGEKEIRLDIGTTSDIYHFINGNKTLSFGADLFTYTRLRGESDFHFPVDAIDYLFGINAGYKIINKKNEYGLRFRLSHISAHFVDGHFDTRTQDWRDGKIPRVFSREFIDLFPFYRINGFRAYLGFTFLFHTTHKNAGKGIYQAGFDYYITNLSNNIFTPFIAYDFKLNNIDKFFGNNILSAGIKFGNFKAKGFSIIFSYFSGKSIHGQYFDVNENYATFGFNMDL